MSSLGTGVDRNGSRHSGAAGIGGAMSDQGLKRKRTGGYPVQERREFRKPLQVSGSRSRGWLAPVLLGSAAALGGAVIYNRWQARDAERQYPPIGRFLDVDGVRLHYIERGQGDPLVLIHGNGTMIQDFTVSGLVDRLADRYRVIVIDRPGYGYSSRPRQLWTPYAHARLFREALAQLGVEQAVVYGHSWGTLVAMALALEFPSLVRGLVLGSGYYYPTLRADTFLFSPPAIPVIGDGFHRGRGGGLGGLSELAARGTHQSGDEESPWLARESRPRHVSGIQPRPQRIPGLSSRRTRRLWPERDVRRSGCSQLAIEGDRGGGEAESKIYPLAQLLNLPRVEMTSEIRCVEGWSTVVHWSGVRLKDFAAATGVASRTSRAGDVFRGGETPFQYASVTTPGGGYFVGLDIEMPCMPRRCSATA